MWLGPVGDAPIHVSSPQRCHDNGHESRLVYTEANNDRGFYQYFACIGRTNFGCDLPHLPTWQVEDRTIDHYLTIEPPEGSINLVTDALDEALHDAQRSTHDLHQALRKRLAERDTQEERFLDLLTDGSLPSLKVRERLQKIQLDRNRIREEKEQTDKQLAIGAETFKKALDMLATPHTTYLHSNDDLRRTINDALFKAVYLDEHGLRHRYTDATSSRPDRGCLRTLPHRTTRGNQQEEP